MPHAAWVPLHTPPDQAHEPVQQVRPAAAPQPIDGSLLVHREVTENQLQPLHARHAACVAMPVHGSLPAGPVHAPGTQ